MNLADKFKQRKFDNRRLEAFSDGVFAIVMTILVLDLKVPHIDHPESLQDVWMALVTVKSALFSWAVSFFFVTLIWMHHHSILSMSTDCDYGTAWINAILLFLICLLPFPTAMMGEYPKSPFIVFLWGLLFSATTFLLTWFYYYNVKNYLSPKYDIAAVMRNVRFSILGGPLCYFIAAVLAFFSVYISYVIYALVPLLYILPLDRETGPGHPSH